MAATRSGLLHSANHSPPLFVFMPPLTFTFLPPPAAASHACLIQQRDVFEYRCFEFDRLDDCRRARKLLLFDREKMCQTRYRNDTMQSRPSEKRYWKNKMEISLGFIELT